GMASEKCQKCLHFLLPRLSKPPVNPPFPTRPGPIPPLPASRPTTYLCFSPLYITHTHTHIYIFTLIHCSTHTTLIPAQPQLPLLHVNLLPPDKDLHSAPRCYPPWDGTDQSLLTFYTYRDGTDQSLLTFYSYRDGTDQS